MKDFARHLFGERAVRLPFMTVRRWMILIAVVAMLLGGERLRQRWAFLRNCAADHGRAEAIYRSILAFYVREIEEGERLLSRRPVESGLNTEVLEPFYRLVASSADYDQYLKTKNLPMYRSALARFTSLVAYHAEMRQKYELAAKHPWLSVEPDPAPP